MSATVGIRELRRDLSGYLRRVAQGESFAVTSRGREIALLGPPAAPQGMIERLVRQGRATPARGDFLELEPLTLPGGPALSKLLDEVRAETSS